MTSRGITVIGMNEDGCAGLTSRAVSAVAEAELLVGGERHLSFFPQFPGRKVSLRCGLPKVLDVIEETSAESNVAVLASGDPLFFGIARRIIDRVGGENVEVIPAPSSMQWAFARLSLPWHDALFLSFHGRPLEGLVTRLKRSSKACIFTDETNSPPVLARRMLEYGERNWIAWVCEGLTGPDERVRKYRLTELADLKRSGTRRKTKKASPLNLLVLLRETPLPAGVPSFLPEESFAKRTPAKGLITKREIRALSLAHLRLTPSSVVWDIGAGSGSLTVEAAHQAFEGRVYAVERNRESVRHCEENIRRFGADNARVVSGEAPEALENLETPDAIFIGGSGGRISEIIEAAHARLAPGGRIVLNAVTLDGVSAAFEAFRSLSLLPEVVLAQISRGRPIAGHLKYEALNPVHILSVTKGGEGRR